MPLRPPRILPLRARSHRDDALTFYPAPLPAPHACILILPGGGYSGLSADRVGKEGETIAAWLNAFGISAAVLRYRTASDTPTPLFPAPLHDASRAMRVLRSMAAELEIRPERVGVLGFSAGGHLASLLSVAPDLEPDPADDLAERFSARPDRSVLVYPVIAMTPPCHQGSSDNLVGKNATATERQRFDTFRMVSLETPPTFLFHTADDAVVPVQGVYDYARALAEHKVPHEVHVYPSGQHGMGLGLLRQPPVVRTWPDRLRDWLEPWMRSE